MFVFLAAAAAVVVAAAALAPGCSGDPHGAPLPREVATGVQLVGRIAHPLLTESSGIVASRRHPGVFWSHNDGASKTRTALYGLDRQGRSLGVYHFVGPRLHDWEDIAIDNDGHLYVGDIGNNDCKREEIAVYEIDEPDPALSASGEVAARRGFRLQFPGPVFDCESLVVQGDTGWLISKLYGDKRAGLYRFALRETAGPQVLEFVTQLTITTPVTGADLSIDGRMLGVVGHSGAFVYHCDGDLSKLGAQKPFHAKFPDRHIEACCFVPDGLLVTAESREIYLFTDPRFRPAQ
jgi:hypothetical protein